jgi:hypothetical protein
MHWVRFMRDWFSRLGFSFIIIACVLAYTGYQASQQGAQRWRVIVQYVGAALLLGAGLAGLRERHRK